MLQIRWLAAFDIPFSSSKTTCSISTTSCCWVLKSKGTPLMMDSQIQNGHSIEDLLNFLVVFLIRVLLKPSFLKQHKTDLEQYPLAPTIIAKSFTYQPLDSIIVFKAKYLLISTVPRFHIFLARAG